MMSSASPVVVQVAMDQEAEPFLEAASTRDHVRTQGPADFHRAQYDFGTAIIVRSGIGIANAASATAQAVMLYTPSLVLVAGSAGGVGKDIRVSDVVIAESSRFHDSDATAFGYEPGQVPDMPAAYPADAAVLEAGRAWATSAQAAKSPSKVQFGEALSGSSFITEANIGPMRDTFPRALCTDMETAAAAQTAYSFGVPFGMVRAISDLCGPKAGDDFSLSLAEAASVSAQATLGLLRAVNSQS